jgi:hypothetical protein
MIADSDWARQRADVLNNVGQRASDFGQLGRNRVRGAARLVHLHGVNRGLPHNLVHWKGIDLVRSYPPTLLNSRLTAYRAGGLQSVRAALLCRRVRRDPPELCPQRALQHSRLEIRTADSHRARCTVAKIANRRLFDEFAGRETVANSPRRSDADASRGGFDGYQAESSAGGESDSKNTNAHGSLHSVSAPKIGSVSQN